MKAMMMKLLVVPVFLGLSLLNGCVNNDFPAREVVLLSGEWRFSTSSADSLLLSENPAAEISSGRLVDVPHTWNVDLEDMDHYGTGWYQKEVKVPNSMKDKCIYIEFERVYHDAVIWINGKMAFEHIGAGYTTFSKEITEFVQVGKSNTFAVRVDNRPGDQTIPFMGSFDWAMDGGIIGHVNLVATGAPSVAHVLAHPIYTSEGDVNDGEVSLEVLLDHDENIDPGRLTFQVAVKEENQATSEQIFSGTMNPILRDGNYFISIGLPGINLWHFDSPNLYEIELRTLLDGKVTDSYSTTFGFRRFEITEGKLFLNDEQVRLVGVEWMPGSDPEYGFAEPEEYIEHVIDDMKNANCIFTRFHWQQSKATIDYCNRKGILVQEEIPIWQQPSDFSEPPLWDIAALHAEEMIMRDFNAPCIISWGIGNELQSTSETAKESLLQLKELVEIMDSTRIVSYVSNHVGEHPEEDVSAYFDWVMMNDYYGTWFGKDAEAAGLALDKIHEIYPDKPVIISEWGLCEPRFTGGDERRTRDMAAHYAQYIERPFVQGYIYFNYNDYRTHMGEEGEGKLRRRVHGVVDLNLVHKPSYEMLKKLSCPVRMQPFTWEDGKLTLRLLVSHTLPAYAIRDYVVSLREAASGDLVNEAILEHTGPGEIVEHTMPVPLAGEYLVEVSRGTGHNVLRHSIKLEEN